MSSLRFLELALLGSFYALRLPRLDSTRVGQRYDDNAKTRYSPRSEDKRERERERERERRNKEASKGGEEGYEGRLRRQSQRNWFEGEFSAVKRL